MNNGAPYAQGQQPRDRSAIATRADNLIRQRLRIGNPLDPKEVAEGLRRLFPNQARTLELEAKGLPLLPGGIPGAPPPLPAASPTTADREQAIDDVERDLRTLATNSQLKDIEPELAGWSQAIRSVIADGLAAAPLALDPRSRDRAFAARRQLGDYARMARLVGAMTQTLNQPYRQLAKSLDETSAVIVVMAGEAISAMNLGSGRFLLAAPASELQTRRDAIMAALRTVTGAKQESYGNGEWPWGLHGLREILRRIEESGHLDLRALFDENVMARLMDDLIDQAATHNSRGLRALGATADVALQRLYRLLHVVDNRIDPESPVVATLFKAIQLFVDAFEASRSGYRLPTIARSPLLLTGLRGLGGPDVATDRLLRLIHARGRLAELLDCYLGCGCCGDEVQCQILLDKLLYDVDRAIDLYALGSDQAGRGEPEWRAAAYGVMIAEFEVNYTGFCLSGLRATVPGTIRDPDLVPFGPLQPPLVVDEEEEEEEAPECIDPRGACEPVDRSQQCSPRLQELRDLVELLRDILLEGKTPNPLAVPLQISAISQAEADGFREIMRDELCVQRLADRRWESLVATMAPTCVPAEQVMARIDRLIRCAIGRLHGANGVVGETVCTDCAEPDVSIPPTTETSLDGLVRMRASQGRLPPRRIP